ncbi:hypothetical protein A7K91_01920 [Paenibacillus oryzae]|uniref:Uncharacterized protein n=1 Tax=Paenibacillus oryzae TaxID=1844972 RepID=A0A1A5Y9Z1_9BACL|nr:hypothetical protein [Paenibacillus oryzae]OBR62397.1 hypothetical protein A7K91_01920 [Paenibacillus oryzae]
MSKKMKVSGWERGAVRGAYRGKRKFHHHEDFAVEGIQEISRDLSKTFARLRCRRNARRLVHAIRCCDAATINCLLAGCHSRVVCFFKKPGYDCVKICSFGRGGAATITFDICVRSLCNGYGNGYGYGGGYGGGYGFF